MNAITIVSGGVDSVTLAYKLAHEGHALHLLAFDYGQRHHKELGFACWHAKALGAAFHVVNLSGLGALFKGSALTDATVPVPDGHYAAPNMAQTVVPNRNAIMLSVACGVAASGGVSMVALGVHGGDHPIYADCRPAFIGAFNDLLRASLDGCECGVRVVAPFMDWTKADIVREGAALGVPYEQTWSCYKGGAVHCGTCGTCVERREAFALARVADPTEYA